MLDRKGDPANTYLPALIIQAHEPPAAYPASLVNIETCGHAFLVPSQWERFFAIAVIIGGPHSILRGPPSSTLDSSPVMERPATVSPLNLPARLHIVIIFLNGTVPKPTLGPIGPNFKI
jgi:hypothetical protein